MPNEPKQPEEVDEISAEELESVTGGAKGHVARTRQKELLTLVSVDGSSKDSG